MSSNEAMDFLRSSGSGESHDAVKFTAIGDHITGTIIDTPHVVERPSLRDGTPEQQLPINIETTEGPRTLWVRKGFLSAAITEAVDKAGAAGVLPGGKLTVQYIEDRDTGKPNPAKIFRAKYEPPVAAPVSVADVFGDELGTEPF